MDGRRLFFDEMGIYNGLFVMKDRETGSMWSHYTGEAMDGPLKGKRLDWIKTERGEYGRLLEAHPGASTLERSQLRWKKNSQPLTNRAEKRGDLRKDFKKTTENLRDDLPEHTHGLGVAAGDDRKFYPIDLLYDNAVITDKVGKVDVVVLIHDGSSTAAAYSSCLEGEMLKFEATEHENESALVDQNGTIWTADGRGVWGPGKGKRLTSTRSMITDWYGWAAFFPDTELYKPSAKPKQPKE